jgi:hypothetical protein
MVRTSVLGKDPGVSALVEQEVCVLCNDTGWISVVVPVNAVVFKGVWDAEAEAFFIDGKKVKYDSTRKDLHEVREVYREFAKRCICAPVGSADHPAGTAA